MNEIKITCNEWDCCSLPNSIGKKIRGHEMLTHTFTKSMEDKTNQNKNIKNSR